MHQFMFIKIYKSFVISFDVCLNILSPTHTEKRDTEKFAPTPDPSKVEEEIEILRHG